MTKSKAIVWIAQVVLVALIVNGIRADEIDDNIKKINDELIDAQIAAHQRAIVRVRDLQSDLVKSDDERQEQMREWKEELDIKLSSLRDLKGVGKDVLSKLEKEFELIGKGEWWWLNKENPIPGERWYRVNAGKNRWEHMGKGPDGNPHIDPAFSPTYEILGLDKADDDIILVKMVYPPKGAGPGDRAVLRFNRKTGVIDTPWGWYADPKKRKE